MTHLFDYYIIHGWMQSGKGLGLKRLELSLYAIIYSYSKDGLNSMYASTTYLAEILNVAQPRIVEALKSLVEKDLVKKETITENGYVKGCNYTVNFDKIRQFISL